MAKKKLTASSVKSMKAASTKGPTQIFDTEQRGLCLRVYPSGAKVFSAVYKLRGRMRRFTLGKFPDLKLAEARQATRDKLSQVAKGVDPQDIKLLERASGTFKDLTEKYVTEYAKKRKRSWPEDNRMIGTYLLPRFEHVRPNEVTHAEMRALLNKIADGGAPIQANRVLALTRKLFNWAIIQGLATSNPCVPMERPGTEQRRSRILTDAEIAAVWRAAELEKAPLSSLPKLLLLTLKRSGETVAMRWQDLDLEHGSWRIPAESTKTGEPDLVPLSPAAIEILKGLRKHSETEAKKHKREVPEWVFPNPRDRKEHMTNVQKFIDRVRDNSKIDGVVLPHWTGHDLRRTGRSYMGQLRVPVHVSERLMGHKQQGVLGVYDRYDYFQEKAEALNKWAKRVTVIVSGLREVKSEA